MTMFSEAYLVAFHGATRLISPFFALADIGKVWFQCKGRMICTKAHWKLW